MSREPVTALAIYPDKRVEEVKLGELKDYQEIVQGFIEAVSFRDGSTMYVNEEFLLGQFGPEDFNSIASDVAGLGGRPDLMMTGILGPVLLLGGVDDEGYDLDVTEAGRRMVHRVKREAGGPR